MKSNLEKLVKKVKSCKKCNIKPKIDYRNSISSPFDEFEIAMCDLMYKITCESCWQKIEITYDIPLIKSSLESFDLGNIVKRTMNDTIKIWDRNNKENQNEK